MKATILFHWQIRWKENKGAEGNRNDLIYNNITSDRIYGGEDYAIEHRGKFILFIKLTQISILRFYFLKNIFSAN